MILTALLSEYSPILERCLTDSSVIRKARCVDAMTAVLAGGHILLEDVREWAKRLLSDCSRHWMLFPAYSIHQ